MGVTTLTINAENIDNPSVTSHNLLNKTNENKRTSENLSLLQTVKVANEDFIKSKRFIVLFIINIICVISVICMYLGNIYISYSIFMLIVFTVGIYFSFILIYCGLFYSKIFKRLINMNLYEGISIILCPLAFFTFLFLAFSNITSQETFTDNHLS